MTVAFLIFCYFLIAALRHLLEIDSGKPSKKEILICIFWPIPFVFIILIGFCSIIFGPFYAIYIFIRDIINVFRK
jgi:hypothetical protein